MAHSSAAQQVNGARVSAPASIDDFPLLRRSNVAPVHQDLARVGTKDPVLLVTPSQLRFVGMPEPRSWRMVVLSRARASERSYRERL